MSAVGTKRTYRSNLRMSVVDPGCVKTPTLNLRVEFLSQFRLVEPDCTSDFFGRKQLRKQFCASLAQASFHTA